jgi:UDP-3-O-[3-hydroxymyristoyl] glucosamine N-acyltransferase
MTLGELAARLGASVEGPEEIEVSGIAGIDDADENQLTFVSNPKYLPKLASTRAAAVILGPDIGLPEGSAVRALLRASNPYLAFAHSLDIFHPAHVPAPGVHPTAVVSPGARLGRNASIGPYVVIEDGVTIGDDCVLKSFVMIYKGATIGGRFLAHSHAVVRENVRIGNDVILQNGAVIGSDGFGFARRDDGAYHKIVQSGTVVVEDEVEVQAYACIDRATVGETRIRRGVKTDNLVQVGHGCEVGENTLLCAQVGLAGSTKVGRQVILTGQVGAAGHLTIGDNSIVTPQSGVAADVAANQTVSGSPAIDHFLWLKSSTLFAKLPEIYSTLRKLRDAAWPSKQ